MVSTTNFYGIAGSSADNVLLVGSGGAIVHWDGSRLEVEDSGTSEDLRGVCVVSRDDAWAAGAHGTLLHRVGGKWAQQGDPSMAYFNAVWSDGAQVVAVGVKGAAVAYTGRAIEAVPTDSPDDLFALTRTKQGLFAVGTLGTIAAYDMNARQFKRSALTGYSKTLTALAASGGDAWLVGLGGAIYRSNGSDVGALVGAVPVMGAPPVFVRGVAAPGAGSWVVGFDGLVARVLGGKVTVVSGVPDRWYEAVWGAADDDLWIVGNAGTVLRTNRAALVDGGAGDAGIAGDGGGRG